MLSYDESAAQTLASVYWKRRITNRCSIQANLSTEIVRKCGSFVTPFNEMIVRTSVRL
jgi:hypothetical protein